MANKPTIPNAVNEALGLPLADAFERELNEALEAAGEVDSVVLAMIDLDEFDKINKRYGHAAGDEVLIKTGEYLKGTLKNGGRLYRYAGDSFAIILTGVEKEDAFLMLEEMRRGYDMTLPGGEQLTLTIGLCAAPEDGARYTELVRKADGAMYRGKMSGRNRICLAREEKMVTKTSHYTVEQLQRLTKLSKRDGIGEAIMLREALDALLKKYDV